MTLIELALARIAEMEKRAEGATPGPWRVEQPWGGFSAIRSGDDPLFFTSSSGCRNAENDHAFCASARTDLPALCALLKPFLRNIPEEDLMQSELAALKAFTEAR